MTIRKLAAALILAGVVTVTVAFAARPENPDLTAVRAALEHYLAGHATGQGSEFSQAFHPDSRLFWVQDGQLRTRTSADYIAGASGKPADDEALRKRRIVSIDIEGTAAMGKIELDYPSGRFVDYMSLLKINDQWLIVNKTFHRQPR